MVMQLGHVHIKTREDPQKVAKFYIDNFGATVKREIPRRGCQLDLHGVQLNVTTIIADQNHEQHVGIEHIAIETDDYSPALANLKQHGAQTLQERINTGRHALRLAPWNRSSKRSGASASRPKPSRSTRPRDRSNAGGVRPQISNSVRRR